jgi:hypothetical protein
MNRRRHRHHPTGLRLKLLANQYAKARAAWYRSGRPGDDSPEHHQLVSYAWEAVHRAKKRLFAAIDLEFPPTFEEREP